MTTPRAIIDVGFSSPTIGNVFTIGDPAKGKVNLYPISGNVWVDITPYVRSWSLRYGATRGDDPSLRYEPATATIELNDGDRRFDPENLAGPYVSAGVSQIEPMRRVRIRLIDGTTSYPAFYGLSDDFTPQYVGNDHTITTLTATDGLKVFGGNNRLPSVAAGAGEDTGARITRILNAAGWPASERVIATGDTTVQATTLEGNALSELQLTQDTELGEFYLDRDGRTVFRNRQALFLETRSKVSQAVFGDAGLAAGEIPYADAKPSTGADAMANQVTITRVDGTPQTVQNAGSISKFLIKTYERSDLVMQADTEALSYAKSVLYQYGNPRPRFTRIEFNTVRPHEAVVVWPKLLGRELGDRVTVRRRPAGGGTLIQRDCFIRGVEMSSGQADELLVNFVLGAADRYSFFVIGDPVLGRVGYNSIAY